MLCRKGKWGSRHIVQGWCLGKFFSKKMAFEQKPEWSQKATPCGSLETGIALQTSGSARAEPRKQGVLKFPSRGTRPGMHDVLQERSSAGEVDGMRWAVQLGPESRLPLGTQNWTRSVGGRQRVVSLSLEVYPDLGKASHFWALNFKRKRNVEE